MFTALSILTYLSKKTTTEIDDKLVKLLEKQIADTQKSWISFRDYFFVGCDYDFSRRNYFGQSLVE